MSEELADLRRDYAAGGLDEGDLEADPIAMFRRWLHDATVAGLHEPNAMVVATAAPDGTPAARMVLLKGLDKRGFVFFTNYDSRKGEELTANPRCALLFPWHDLERQVRVEGAVEPARRGGEHGATSAAARAAPSSAPGRRRSRRWCPPGDVLDERYDEASRPASGRTATCRCPRSWGGFLVAPDMVEFWQGRRGRMHDRLRYLDQRRLDHGGWVPSGSRPDRRENRLVSECSLT